MDIAVPTNTQDHFVQGVGRVFESVSSEVPTQLWAIASTFLSCLPPGSALEEFLCGEDYAVDEVGARLSRLHFDERMAVVEVHFTPRRHVRLYYRVCGSVAEARDALLEKINEVNGTMPRPPVAPTSVKSKQVGVLERLPAVLACKQAIASLKPLEALVYVLWLTTKLDHDPSKSYITSRKAFVRVMLLAELPQFVSAGDVGKFLYRAKARDFLNLATFRDNLYLLRGGRKRAQAIEKRLTTH